MNLAWPTHAGNSIAAIAENGEEVTYGSLNSHCQFLCSDLNNADLVAIECTNSPSSLVAIHGILQNGIPTLLVDAQLAAERRLRLYNQFAVSCVFDSTNNLWNRRAPTGPKLHPDLQLLLSTSGSMGAPKLVRLSRRNVLSNARQIAHYLNLTQDSRAISVLPFHYAFGLSVLTSHLYAGGSMAVTHKSVIERPFWDFFDLAKPDSFAGVPTTFEQLRRLKLESHDLPSLRNILQAGGKLRRDWALEWAQLAAKRNWKFYRMYGQTEATARMAYLPPELAISKPHSIGGPVPEGRLELKGEDGKIISTPGSPGELIFYGPNVMMGYADSADDLAKGDELGGCLATGDIAQVDEDGHYSIVGRLKRFIKINGNRIGLDFVESELHDLGLKVTLAGEDELLLVIASYSSVASTAVAAIVERFGIPKRNVKEFIVPELPLGGQGKIQYSQLLESFKRERSNHGVG